ncbi:MAG: hypothetical protein ABI402_15325 [Ferruginibacter sp.]
MIKTITNSYAKNIEAFKRVIATCKRQLMRARPIEGFPHYWALIPVERKSPMQHKRDAGQMMND